MFVRANPPLWPDLRCRVQRASAAFGVKAELARKLNVTPQAVNQWLSGVSAPDAENTLQLLKWVTAEEAQKQRSPGSASNTARAATRRKDHRETKPTPG